MAAIKKITPKMQTAIEALLNNESAERAALLAGVGVRSVYRWKKQPEFREALDKAQSDVFKDSLGRLAASAEIATNCLLHTIQDDEASAGVRVRAALGIIETVQRHIDFRELESRLAKLEASGK